MALNKGVYTTSTFTLGTKTYKVASAPVQKGVTREAVNVTDLSQGVMQYVAGAVENWDEFTLTVYDDGTAPATSSAPEVYSVTSTISDGVNQQAVSISFKALITKIAPSTVESEGGRKATLDLTIQPTGETAA